MLKLLDVLDLETPKDFCRLWSALQFTFLNPTQEQIDGAEPCNVEVNGYVTFLVSDWLDIWRRLLLGWSYIFTSLWLPSKVSSA